MSKQVSFIPVFYAYIPPGQENSIEERFLFEYLADSFYPLLRVFEGLENEGIAYGFTLCLSPVLAGMLADPGLMLRFESYVGWRLKVVQEALLKKPGAGAQLGYYENRFRDILYWHRQRYHYQPLKGIFNLAALGHLEVIFSNAGNGILPLLEGVLEAAQAEIRATKSEFRYHSEGTELRGLWPAELAYSRGNEEILSKENIAYFFVDESALRFAPQAVINGCARPVLLHNGVVALAPNRRLAEKLTPAPQAYCYDKNYAKTGYAAFADMAFQLLPEQLRTAGVDRNKTGIALYNTGGDLYSAEAARNVADRHAEHYISLLLEEVQRQNSEDGIIVVALDHELVGGYWQELPVFIDMLLRKMCFDCSRLAAQTPGRYLQQEREYQQVQLADSSMAKEGIFSEFYQNEREHFLPELHLAARKLACGELGEKRVADQMARELLLAQGCEWRFYGHKGIDEEYARERQKKRLARFAAGEQMLRSGVDLELLTALEERCGVLGTAGVECFR